MSDRDPEDNNTAESRPGTSTEIGAQNMPSTRDFVGMFKAALAPGQLNNLNENVSLLLLDGHDQPDEVGETYSDGPSNLRTWMQI